MAHSPLTVGSGDHHVLALHGWFGSARGWGSLPDYLDGSAFTYVFMDLRGYGDRQQAGGEFTMAEAAADALALADDLGWDRFSLIGHSMGGKASHQVLLQAPDRVRKLVGINPVPATSVPMDEQGWALFSGAAAQAGNRAAIIDFTTGNKLTKTFIDQVVRRGVPGAGMSAAAHPLVPGWPVTEVVFDPATYVDGVPFDALAVLRRDTPVAWVAEIPVLGWPEGPGFWLVLRHAEVESVLTRPQLFSSSLGATQIRDPATPQALGYVRRMMLNMDPPEHSRLRRLLGRSFTPRAVAQLEQRIRGHARAICDRVLVSSPRLVSLL